MRNRSMNNGNGNSTYNGPQAGPRQDQSVVDARAISMTFWELV